MDRTMGKRADLFVLAGVTHDRIRDFQSIRGLAISMRAVDRLVSIDSSPIVHHPRSESRLRSPLEIAFHVLKACRQVLIDFSSISHRFLIDFSSIWVCAISTKMTIFDEFSIYISKIALLSILSQVDQVKICFFTHINRQNLASLESKTPRVINF